MSKQVDISPSTRRRIRRRWILLLIPVVFVAAFGVALFRAMTARPTFAVDYGRLIFERCQQLQPASIDGDPSQNGWPKLLEAYERLNQIEEHVLSRASTERTDMPSELEYFELLSGEWTPGAHPREMAVLHAAESEGLFALLDDVRAAPFVLRPAMTGHPLRPLTQTSTPDLRACRRLVRVTTAAMRKAAAERDWPALERAASHTFMIGRVYSQQGITVNYLAAKAILDLGQQELTRILDEYAVPHANCERLRDTLAKQQSAPLEHIIECERLELYDLMQYLYTDDGSGNGCVILSRLDGLPSTWGAPDAGPDLGPLKNLVAPFFASRSETKDMIDFVCDEAIRRSKMSLPERHAQPIPDLDAYVENLKAGHFVAASQTSLVPRLVMTNDRFSLSEDALRIMLALEMYAVDHDGAFPSALDALVPEYLEALLLDPVSGKSYGYRLFDVSADAGRDYLLYSIGHDRTDNDGTSMPEGEYDLAPVFDEYREGRGYDYILNPPRHEPYEE